MKLKGERRPVESRCVNIRPNIRRLFLPFYLLSSVSFRFFLPSFSFIAVGDNTPPPRFLSIVRVSFRSRILISDPGRRVNRGRQLAKTTRFASIIADLFSYYYFFFFFFLILFSSYRALEARIQGVTKVQSEKCRCGRESGTITNDRDRVARPFREF